MKKQQKVSGETAPLISMAEFARRLDLAVVTVRMKVARRELDSIKIGRRVLIPESEAVRLVAEGYRPRFQRELA